MLEYIQDLMVQQHQKYHEKSAQVATRLNALLSYVSDLEVRTAPPVCRASAA